MQGGPWEFGTNSGPSSSHQNFADEPPLLEELGIDFNKIVERTISVLNPMKKVTLDMITARNADGQVVQRRALIFCGFSKNSYVAAGRCRLRHGRSLADCPVARRCNASAGQGHTDAVCLQAPYSLYNSLKLCPVKLRCAG